MSLSLTKATMRQPLNPQTVLGQPRPVVSFLTIYESEAVNLMFSAQLMEDHNCDVRLRLPVEIEREIFETAGRSFTACEIVHFTTVARRVKTW